MTGKSKSSRVHMLLGSASDALQERLSLIRPAEVLAWAVGGVIAVIAISSGFLDATMRHQWEFFYFSIIIAYVVIVPCTIILLRQVFVERRQARDNNA